MGAIKVEQRDSERDECVCVSAEGGSATFCVIKELKAGAICLWRVLFSFCARVPLKVADAARMLAEFKCVKLDRPD